MIENRRAWLDLLLSPRVEGTFADDPMDTPTMRGVTLATYRAWKGPDATIEQLKTLDVPGAEAIALAMYWTVVRGDDLPGGLDVAVADCAYHSGPGTAARLLQKLVATDEDGHVGELTVSAARRQADTPALIRAYNAARLSYLQTLGAKWQRFGNGWVNRLGVIEPLCLRLVQPNSVEAGLTRSKIVWGSVGGLAASLTAIAGALPEIVGAGQRAQAAVQAGDVVQVMVGLAGIAGTLLAIWSRVDVWRKGRLTVSAPAASGAKA